METTIVLTTGVAGTGKTYRRASVEIFRFLLEENGNHWSNFPFYADKIARECSERSGRPAKAFLRRLKPIPKAELDSWMLAFERRDSHKCRGPFTYFRSIPYTQWQSGEWERSAIGWAGKDYPQTVVKYVNDNGETMAGIDLTGAHIAIDECHNFCRKSGTTPKHQRELWGAWLGEIRHIGATVEFLTQSPHKLADEISKEAEVRIDLINVEAERDPFFKIKMCDWYELKASHFGKYEAKVQLREKKCVDGRWKLQHTEYFTRDPFYFQFYNSYNTPHAGGFNASGRKHEFEHRSKLSLLGWFVRRNVWPLGSRLSVAALIIWICFLGGGKFLFTTFVGGMRSAVDKHTQSGVVSPEAVTPPPAAAPVVAPVVPVPSRRAVSSITPPRTLGPASGRYDMPGPKVVIKPKYCILMLTLDSVLFNDRNYYVIGETIGTGPLKGQRITKIDFKKRRLYTNKTAVLLGQRIDTEKEKDAKQTKQTPDPVVRDGLDGH